MTFTYQELEDELQRFTLKAFDAEDKLEKVKAYAYGLRTWGDAGAASNQVATDILYLIGENP